MEPKAAKRTFYTHPLGFRQIVGFTDSLCPWGREAGSSTVLAAQSVRCKGR